MIPSSLDLTIQPMVFSRCDSDACSRSATYITSGSVNPGRCLRLRIVRSPEPHLPHVRVETTQPARDAIHHHTTTRSTISAENTRSAKNGRNPFRREILEPRSVATALAPPSSVALPEEVDPPSSRLATPPSPVEEAAPTLSAYSADTGWLSRKSDPNIQVANARWRRMAK